MKIRRLVQALALGAALLAPHTSALAATAYCYVAEVMVLANRVHVLCDQPLNNLPYFAVPASDSNMAIRFTQMASTAWSEGQPLFVEYDPYADASSFGCAYHDCRRALSAWLSVKF
jgi:hypothetical protein